MTRWPNQGDQYRTPIPKPSDELRRQKILNLFCRERLDTFDIAKAMNEPEYDIERTLHRMLEVK